MIIQAQFTYLPVEYFNYDALFKLAQAIGHPIKMDIHTSKITRGMYARVCIEVDINKPLPPFIRINNLKQTVAYEVNTCYCNECRVIGYFPAQCTSNSAYKDINTPNQQRSETGDKECHMIEKRCDKKGKLNAGNRFDDKNQREKGAQKSYGVEIWTSKDGIVTNKEDFSHNGDQKMLKQLRPKFAMRINLTCLTHDHPKIQKRPEN